MQPRDQIVGGTTLRIPAIQSANFVSGASGWAIFQNGNAEFNGATFRGTVIIEGGSQAILIYSGIPAAGNLLISIAGTAGVDAFGNGYPLGFAINPAGTNTPAIELTLLAGAPIQFFPSGLTKENNAAAFQLSTFGSGTAAWAQLTLKSANMVDVTDFSAVTLSSSSDDGTSNHANVALVYVDSSGTPHVGIQVSNGLTAAPMGLSITGAGNGLKVAEGSNAKQGTAVLTAGQVVVSNTSVTANSRIFLTSQVDGGTPGFLRVSTRTAGTSFTIKSSSATDTSTVAYEIIEPA